MKRKKFKWKPKAGRKPVVIAVVAVIALVIAWQSGLFGGRPVGLDFRPWQRSQWKPVGVRIETAGPEPVRAARPRPVEMPEPASVPPRTGSAKLAIILDDWGMSEDRLDDAVALKRPVTLAILPNLPHSASIAREAAANGLGVMLHMPMQAQSRAAAREPDVIGVDMAPVRIRRFLDEALASVPGVRGVNNHQGSAATSDPQVMRTVLTHLKGKKLFFIDSFVTASTVGPQVALEVGIPFARRDVFIDNVAEVDAVKQQLRTAIRKARANKMAIAIGHDKRPTLVAIRQMLPEFDQAGVQLVLAEDLVR